MLELIFRTIEIIAVIGGGIIILLKMGRMMGSFEAVSMQQTHEIGEMKAEMKGLSQLITAVAVQKVEMAGMREEILQLRRWYDELRHGKGYVGNHSSPP